MTILSAFSVIYPPGVPRQVRMTACGTRKVGRSQEEVQGPLLGTRHKHSLEAHTSKREEKIFSKIRLDKFWF